MTAEVLEKSEERFYDYLVQRGKYVYLKPKEVAEICGVPIELSQDIVRRLENEGRIKVWRRCHYEGCWGYKAKTTNTTTRKPIEPQFTKGKELYTGVSAPCIPHNSTQYFEGVNIEPPARLHRLCFVYSGYLPPTHTAFLREHAQTKPKDASQWHTGRVPYCTYQVSKRGKLRLFLERDNDNVTRGLESFATFMSQNGYNVNGLFQYSALNSKAHWHAEYGFKASGEVQKYATTRVAMQLVNSKVKVLVGFDRSLDDSWEYDVKIFNAPSPQEAEQIAYKFATPAALPDDIQQMKNDLGSLKIQIQQLTSICNAFVNHNTEGA